MALALYKGCQGEGDYFYDFQKLKAVTLFSYQLCEYCRIRFGYAHVANNKYEEWRMYAIGGSSNPTIFSEGNYFVASNLRFSKQVTK